MLETVVYNIIKLEIIETGFIVSQIKLLPESKIFEGHFPENPVLPGVVSIQIISDLLSKTLNKKLYLNESQNIKFLKLIQPEKDNIIDVNIKYSEISESEIKVSAEILSKSSLCLKFAGKYQKK